MLVEKLQDANVDTLELNVSCPRGMLEKSASRTNGQDLGTVRQVVKL